MPNSNIEEIIREAHKNLTRKKGGTKKIADLPEEKMCKDSEHNPPTHYCYKDGVYEHTCPSCGKKQIFTVRNPSY